MDTITTFLACSLVSLMAYMWFRWQHSNLPPFPIQPFPLVGHLPYLGKNPRPQFRKWRKKCGDIFSLYMGTNLMVIINGYELVRKVLVELGDIALDRPYAFYDAVSGNAGRGLAFSSGARWKEHKAITMNILRVLGMGRNIVVQNSVETVEDTIKVLANLKGKPSDVDAIITISVANVVLSIVIGKRYDLDDKEFLKFCREVRTNIFEADGSNLANYFRFWEYIPGDLFNAKKIRSRTNYIMNDFIGSLVKQKGYDEYDENNLDTFISKYVYEMNKKKKAGETTTMSDVDLKKVIYDLMGGAVDTTATTLKWSLLYFLHYPETQKKAFAEIEREVGLARPPNMNDKPQLHYVNAVINETQRISSVLPLNVPRQCTETISINGYTIPKGTTIVPSLDSVLFDKKIWGQDVYTFRPERFLDKSGKVTNPEEFVPFSMGRRMCPGEFVARVQLFLFLSSMVQRFEFLPEDPTSLPPLTVNFGITATPNSYKIRLIDRIK